jgi:hypothetical protein
MNENREKIMYRCKCRYVKTFSSRHTTRTCRGESDRRDDKKYMYSIYIYKQHIQKYVNICLYELYVQENIKPR